MRLALILALGLSATPAMAQTPPPAAPPAAPAPPPPTLLSVKDVMRHIVNPAAERFWKTSGSIVTEAGVEERAPTTDESWTEMEHSAAIVAEAGNLLTMEGRGPADPRWTRYARQLTAAGLASMAAAKAKDGDKAFEAGGEMYNACFACHARYIPRPKRLP